jgi:anti-anti-sigma regulatory factor
VIIDFSRAKILTSANISNLILLKGLLSLVNHQLILCNVSTLIKYIFTRLGLGAFFEFVGDKSAALAAVTQQQ